MYEEEQDVKVIPEDISEVDYEIACSILDSSIRLLFQQPGIKKEYEEWLKSEAQSYL